MPHVKIGLDHLTDLSSPAALRVVARRVARHTVHGRDVLLTVANRWASPMALNFLVNLHALGLKNALLLANDAHVCGVLAAAAREALPADSRAAVLATPCLRDTWWEAHMSRAKSIAIAGRLGVWLSRWCIISRLVRLGYNVLSTDVDVAILADPYPHLHAASLCGRFALGFASDYNWKTPELQSGFMYVCNARPDGAALWMLQEAVDRYLRLADACGGAYVDGGDGGDDSNTADGTLCPPGSWLHAARLYDGFAFDQWLLRGTLHSAIAADGRMWWSVLEDTSSSSWPWKSNRSVAVTIASEQRRMKHGVLRVANGGPPESGRAHSSHIGWNWADVVADSEQDAPLDWRRRFALGPRGHHGRYAFWATLRGGVPLATQLPRAIGEPLDRGWRQACSASHPDAPDTPLQRRAHAQCRQWLRGSSSAMSFAHAAEIGLLPHRRGALSRRWQRLLDADLAAARRRCARETGASVADAAACAALAKGESSSFRDGDGGALWAGRGAGDENFILLPQWIVTHWTVAQRGLVGGPIPHTLFFHATNANDKVRARGHAREARTCGASIRLCSPLPLA